MVTAGANFTHLIADDKDPNHVLVTNGIYAIFRHPSYTGFFYWGIFTQLAAGNPICATAFAFALQRFFASRIIYEERTLVVFFGDAYVEYKDSGAGVWIPFID
ncbi:hypothetical protein HKX48_008198 [Thoreauomyces humboldtii]|nr:hypothetical protein HKX48_008198 [Thoreauomyces humboldtii]